MLPEKLSTDLTSLNHESDRLVIVIEMVLAEDGSLQSSDLYGATVRNRAKLAYNSVAAWLEGNGPIPQGISKVKGFDDTLRLQYRLAQKLKTLRHLHGALDLEAIEARPIFDGDVLRTWVRLLNPPIEGRLESGFEGVKVGHMLLVQLVRTDVERGFIDFKRVA